MLALPVRLWAYGWPKKTRLGVENVNPRKRAQKEHRFESPFFLQNLVQTSPSTRPRQEYKFLNYLLSASLIFICHKPPLK